MNVSASVFGESRYEDNDYSGVGLVLNMISTTRVPTGLHKNIYTCLVFKMSKK